MLSKLNSLLTSHFEYQQHVINQSMKPFLPKIQKAESNYLQLHEAYLQKRKNLKEEVKDNAGLGALERKLDKQQQLIDAAATPSFFSFSFGFESQDDNERKMSAKEFQELKKRYDTKHYNLLIDIERRCMKKDTRHIDKSESLLMFTKN